MSISPFLEFKDIFYRVAKAIVQDDQEAMDIVQDVFLKLIGMDAELSKVKNMKSFGLTMVRNNAFNRIKVSKGKHELIPDQLYDPTLNPHQELELKDKVNIVIKLINALPKQQRLIISLRDLEGLSIKEIEDITKDNNGLIRATLSIARKKIREGYLKIMYHET